MELDDEKLSNRSLFHKAWFFGMTDDEKLMFFIRRTSLLAEWIMISVDRRLTSEASEILVFQTDSADMRIRRYTTRT